MAIEQQTITQIQIGQLSGITLVYALTSAGDVWYNKGAFVPPNQSGGRADTRWYRLPPIMLDTSINSGKYVVPTEGGVSIPNTSDIFYTVK